MGLLEGRSCKRAGFGKSKSSLQEVDAGATIREVCRRHGIAETTYYRWGTKYGGMDVNEARRLKQVEEENRRLKRIVATRH